MTKTETFVGSLEVVMCQSEQWLADHPTVRVILHGAPFTRGDGVFTVTIRYDDGNGDAPYDIFSRCGQALCGTGPDWKAQLGRLLNGIKAETIDAMTKGKSRIPPSVWGEIAVHLHDRRMLDLAALENAAIDASLGSLARVYKVRNIEFSVRPSEDGRWPRVKYSAAPYNEAGWWRYAEDGQRRLPDDTLSVYLEFDGEAGPPFTIQGNAPIFYPPNMKVAA